MKHRVGSPLWRSQEDGDMGSVAISYAAGDDIKLDEKLVSYECDVNMAHVCMLVKQQLIPVSVGKKLLVGLGKIQRDWSKGNYSLDPLLEDVHSNIEQTLITRYGVHVGGYLRLGIARNDQVYTDTRLWMRDHIQLLVEQACTLIDAIATVASKHTKTIMPGYTHLRISQPITYGHWLTAKAFHFLDDIHLLVDCYALWDQCPLGIFEMAGTHLAIDRHYSASLLGFSGATPHSLYTASQRGELEYQLLANLGLLAIHIRRSMNELILYSTHEFDLLSLGSAYVTGGTAQPNLTNPDALEVVRANMARIHSASIECAMVMDSLPSGFNRDTQVTKKIVFDSILLMENTLPVVAGIFESCVPNVKRMEQLANANFSTAPDMAIQLSVCGGVSFREAFSVVKTIIKSGAIDSFSKLTPTMINTTAQSVLDKPLVVTRAQIQAVSTARASVMAHDSYGGPAPQQVKRMIKKIKNEVRIVRGVMNQKKKKSILAKSALVNAVKTIVDTKEKP